MIQLKFYTLVFLLAFHYSKFVLLYVKKNLKSSTVAIKKMRISRIDRLNRMIEKNIKVHRNFKDFFLYITLNYLNYLKKHSINIFTCIYYFYGV